MLAMKKFDFQNYKGIKI